MRDNHEGCPELLDASERDGSFFGTLRIIVAGEPATFEFGLDRAGYLSLKRILQTHPFEPRGQYRYFFRGSFGKRDFESDTVTFSVRIEQGATGKGFDFDGPTSLVSNLLWFKSLKDLEAATHLKRLS